MGRDPSIRLYSSRVNVFRQCARINEKKPTYPLHVNHWLDQVMCFDMSAAWILTLPICYVFPIIITAWTIPLAASSLIAQVLGYLLIEQSWCGVLTAWGFNVLLWSVLSFPTQRKHLNQFFQQLYVTTFVANIPVILIYGVIVLIFTDKARIQPPTKRTRDTYMLHTYDNECNSDKVKME